MNLPAGEAAGNDPFARKRVIVAGGTSGIGQACVQELRLHGAFVAVIGKPGSGQPGQDAIEADLTDAAACRQACEQAQARLGGVDAVIHTVGGSARTAGDGLLLNCSREGWQAALRLNLDSAFLVLQWAVRNLLANPRDEFGQRGGVALVGSVLADSPSPRHFGTVGYAVAKAGLEGLVRNAAATHACDGIRINMLKPGLVDTPMAARAIGDDRIAAFLRSKQPLTAGPVSAEACALAIMALIDPRCAGLTGAILTLDGGWSLTDPAAFDR